MKFIIVPVFLFAVYLADDPGDRPMILIRNRYAAHRLIKLLFLTKRTLKPISYLPKENIKKLCLQNINSTLFCQTSVLTDRCADFRPNPTAAAIEKRFQSLKTVTPTTRTIHAAKDIPPKETPVVDCITLQDVTMSLVDIEDNGRIYVVLNMDKSDRFRFSRFLEPVPKADTDSFLNPEGVEEAFDRSVNALDSGRIPRNVCNLNELDHFAACAATYTAMYQVDVTKYRKHSLSIFEERECVRNASVLYVTSGKVSEKFEQSGMGMLPCAVNEPWDKPQFYITNDHKDYGALFVLVKSATPPIVFTLVTRLKNVNAFKYGVFHSPPLTSYTLL